MRNAVYPVAVVAFALFGCSSNKPPACTAIGCNAPDGGDTDAGPGATFSATDLAVAGTGNDDVVAAALSPDGRVGIVYYWDSSQTNRDLAYVEYVVATGQLQHAVTIATGYDRTSDLAITFDDAGASSSAYVAFLGNDPSVNEAIETNGGDGGVFWHQSDLGVAKVDASGALSIDWAVHNGTESSPCGNPLDDRDSPVVGLSPAIAFDGDQLVVMYRNLHSGQNPIQDYARTELGSVIGMPGNWTKLTAICGSDENNMFVDQGVGAGTSVAASGGRIVAATAGEDDIDTTIQGLFIARNDNGAWDEKEAIFTNPPLATSLSIGPRIVADPAGGFGLAWTDLSASKVYFSHSDDGQNWEPYSLAFGAGTGGWYPSLAFDSLQEPAVAYYVCSLEPGVSVGNCPAEEDELDVSNLKPNGNWTKSTIDPEGGSYPTLMFDPSGRMVVVYRSMGGGIRVAVQSL